MKSREQNYRTNTPFKGFEEGKVEFDNKFKSLRQSENIVNPNDKKKSVKVVVQEEPEYVEDFINERVQAEVNKHHKIKFGCWAKWSNYFCNCCGSRIS